MLIHICEMMLKYMKFNVNILNQNKMDWIYFEYIEFHQILRGLRPCTAATVLRTLNGQTAAHSRCKTKANNNTQNSQEIHLFSKMCWHLFSLFNYSWDRFFHIFWLFITTEAQKTCQKTKWKKRFQKRLKMSKKSPWFSIFFVTFFMFSECLFSAEFVYRLYVCFSIFLRFEGPFWKSFWYTFCENRGFHGKGSPFSILIDPTTILLVFGASGCPGKQEKSKNDEYEWVCEFTS